MYYTGCPLYFTNIIQCENHMSISRKRMDRQES